MHREALIQRASRQHSLFTRRQALATGLTDRQIDGGVVAGGWLRVYRGVYRIAGAPITTEQRILAAVLACGEDTMASHRAASWAWGFGEKPALDVAGLSRSRVAPGVITFHRLGAPLRPVPRKGIPCTNPLRTMLDLASLGDAALVERALDRGVASGLVTTTAVAAELDRRAGKGVAGVELLRACLAERLDEGSTLATSALESAMDRLIRRFNLPLPERQHCVAGTPYRLDYAWPLVRVYVEVDGYAHHSGLDPFRHDRRRQNELTLLGWTVLRFTWDDVLRRPAEVAAAILAALAGRPALVG